MRKNTLQRGSVRYIVFQEEGAWYAVGLEFNVIDVGDTPQEALWLLMENIAGYVESLKKTKARVDHLLNQKADSEYEDLWQKLTSHKKEQKIPFNIFSFGRQNLARV